MQGEAQGAGASERRSPASSGSGRKPPAGRPGAPPPCAAPVGADGRPAPADAGAPSDPKRGPHGGVRDGAEGRKPEGAAPETQAPGANPPALLPSAGRLSGRLAALAETAKAYARSAQADNTQRAYAADWQKFASWLRRQGLAGDAARSGSGRPLPRVASRAPRRGAFRRDPRAAAVRHRLALPAARPAARHPRPPYRHRARRHPPPPRPPSPAESRDLRRRTSGHAGDAGDGSAGPARPGDPGDRLRRRPAPLGNRRPRLRARPDRRRLRLDRNLPRRRPPDHPRQDRLARGRDRPRLARPTPARSPCSKPGCGSAASAMVPSSGRSRARTAGFRGSG